MNENLPDVYKNLLKRVEEIENNLSKVSQKSTVFADNVHSEDEKADQTEDDLATEKVAPVEIQSNTFLKMAVHAKKYANRAIPKGDWVEVIGLLTGHIINEDTPMEQIKVNDAWPIGHGDAVSVEIMMPSSFTQVLNELPKGDFIVGWYHSHPSYGNFLSVDDYNTQNRYQRLWRKAIAIVIDPTSISKSNFGFGVFRNTTKEPGSQGYTELSYKVDGLSSAAGNDILSLIRPAFEGNDLKFLEYE